MKTLFLLGIFATLAVIAIKKPDQTAWDFVQEVASFAKTTTDDVVPGKTEQSADGTPASNETSDSWRNINRTVATLRSRARDLESAASRIAAPDRENASPERASDKTGPEAVLAPDVPSETAPASPPSSSKVEVLKLPEIPRLPETSVKTSGVDDLWMPPAAKINARHEPRQDYGDVKALYENASRLLDQIK